MQDETTDAAGATKPLGKMPKREVTVGERVRRIREARGLHDMSDVGLDEARRNMKELREGMGETASGGEKLTMEAVARELRLATEHGERLLKDVGKKSKPVELEAHAQALGKKLRGEGVPRHEVHGTQMAVNELERMARERRERVKRSGAIGRIIRRRRR